MTPQEEQAAWRNRKRIPYGTCSLMQPLMMVIPDDGVIISCPIHTLGHFIRPSFTYSLAEDTSFYKNALYSDSSKAYYASHEAQARQQLYSDKARQQLYSDKSIQR